MREKRKINKIMMATLGHALCFSVLDKATMFNFCFRSEKIQNLMREGGKKTFRKKNIEPIFGKVNEGDEIKKNI